MADSINLEMFTEAGAHQNGHFQLSSGLHSSDYLQCALFLAIPSQAALAGKDLAEKIKTLHPQLIVSPALGGLIIGHETARALNIPHLFTERNQGEMQMRRGFCVGPGQKVVVVEDVVTTGKSTREVISILESMGADVVGVASMINRSPEENPFYPKPYSALLRLELPTWSPEQCPLCKEGIPINKPGSRPMG